jgi:hypothetical protein
MHPGDSSESDEPSQHQGSNEQPELSNEQSSSTPTPTHDLDETDEELSLSDSSRIDKTDSDTPEASMDRQRSLQLEKSYTMTCGSKSAQQKKSAVFEMQYHGSRMSKKFLKTVIWLPTDLTLSLSKGFHNAPKLYHDRMVKSTPKVIGFRSGLRAAGKVCGNQIVYLITFRLTIDLTGISGWLLLWGHRLGHSTAVWIQARRRRRDGQGNRQRRWRCLLEATSRYVKCDPNVTDTVDPPMLMFIKVYGDWLGTLWLDFAENFKFHLERPNRRLLYFLA